MGRWRLDIAYDGTGFHGWATQPGVRTVQEVLTGCLEVVAAPESPLTVVCAGRTDAGVHARGQVAHVDLPADAPDEVTLMRRLRGVLPGDIAVRQATPVDDAFDARFSATYRRYAYRISDRPSTRDPLRRDVLDHPRELDVHAMNTAAEVLVGEHDFAAFCRAKEFATSIRRISECRWSRDEGDRAVLRIQADAFCHSMVRSVVGALTAVGVGRRAPDWVAEILRAGLRDPGVRVMPARGLTLEEVGYPPADEWAARQEITRSVRASAPL
jgi:tRNA pseudouridine38-40 synthase